MSAIDLVTELFKLAEMTLEKFPNWEQRKKDSYFEKLSRYNELKVRDKKLVNQEELLGCEDDLALFLRAYREETKK